MNEKNNRFNEVDLLSCFSIIVKKKFVVLNIFFIFVIFEAIIVFLSPKLYIVSEVLKPPTVKINENLVSLREMEERIRGGIYDYKVSEELGLSKPRNFNFNTAIFPEGNFIKVNLITKKKDLDLNSKILNTFFSVLKKENEPMLNIKMDEIENKIAILKNEASRIELEKERINKHFFSSKDKKVVKNQERENIVIKQLELNLLELNLLELNLQDILIQIDNLKIEKEFVSNVVQLQPPISLFYSTMTDKIRKIIAAGMLGLAVGVALALFLEFWQATKSANMR